LDKFAYRNPKNKDKIAGHFKRGESIAERHSGTDGYIQARLELPMKDPSFLRREDVNEQDEFFQKFFLERARRDEIKRVARSATKSRT
jgi:predicted KAP-like P-loop ATPase